MAIRYIESVSIDGLGNAPERKLFNGYIYDLSYQISLGGDMSTVNATLVSEDGTYSITPEDPSWDRVYPIKIGTKIKFNGYLVGYAKEVQPDAKFLRLEFVDTSSKMDKFWVGLKNKHGEVSKDNILIVGREIHPCDRDYDGDIDEIPEIVDECHPCRNRAEFDSKTEIVNCQDYNKYMIFPVKYNFTDLITELRKYFNIDLRLQNPNPKYLTDYTGTVREVLSSWCKDFGWIFYWEDEKIKFLDLRRTVEINAQIADFCPNLSAFREEFSIKDTMDRLVCTYYERAGTNDEYSCEDAMYFEIPVLEPNRVDLGAELQITNKIPHVAAGLAQYSRSLRDLWYWYDHYSLRAPKDYKPGKFLPKVGLTIVGPPIMLDGTEVVTPGGLETGGLTTGSLQSSSLEPSTGLFAPKGFPTNPEPTSDLEFLNSSVPNAKLQEVQSMILANDKYRMCFELMGAEMQWVVANGLAKNKNDFFFFVGYYDPELHDQHFEDEKNYGATFLNRYHVFVPDLNNDAQKKFFEDYTFRQAQICNLQIISNDNKIDYRFLGTGNGDSVTYFNTPTNNPAGDIDTLSDLPFANWLRLFRDSREAVTAPDRARMFKLIVVEKTNSIFYPSPEVRFSGEDDDAPVQDEIQNDQLIFQAYKNSLAVLEQQLNAQGEFVPRKLLEDSGFELDKSLDRTHVFVFVGRAVGPDDYRIVSANAINPTAQMGVPFDGKPLATEYEDAFDMIGNTIFQYENLKCNMLGNLAPFCFRRSFKTPVATFTYYEPTYSLYGAVLEKNKLIKRKLEKIEMPMWNKTKIAKNAGRIEVVQKDISDDEIRILKNTRNSCRYDMDKIRQFHETMSKHFAFTYDKPIRSSQFTIEGVDITKSPKIENGLISIDISLSENGVNTTYQLGTRLMEPISEVVLIGMDESTRAAGILNNTPSAPIRPTQQF
jgi:hypothetical protein